MSYYECPACGATLDPGETCECGEKGLLRCNGNSPKKSRSPNRDPKHIINSKKEKVNPNSLRELRIGKNIPAKDMVETVKAIYPKFDKALQSKCEHGDEYGIELMKRAMDELYSIYAPEMLQQIKHIRDGRHKLKKKVMCRLPDEDYELLQQYIREDGYATMQDWLSLQITKYLNNKTKEKNNDKTA